MNSWREGDFDKLLSEARAIQNKLQSFKKTSDPEHLEKTFAKLMLQGKVNAALKLLDNSNGNGVLLLSPETIKDLQEKHPVSCPIDESVLIEGELPFVDPAIFNNIDEDKFIEQF